MTDEVFQPDLEPDSDAYDNIEVKNDEVLDEETDTETDEGGE